MLRFWILVLAMLVVAGSAFGATELRAAQDQMIDVELTENVFLPARIAAPPGAVRLSLTNTGFRRHNMVLLLDGQDFDSVHLRPRESTVWELPLDRPGTYLFWCGEYRHLEKGMVGEIRVE